MFERVLFNLPKDYNYPMKIVWGLLLFCMVIILSSCNTQATPVVVSTQVPTLAPQQTATLFPTLPPKPTRTLMPSPSPSPTLVPPSLHEGYPVSPADYTRTGMTDAQFADAWTGGFQAYYRILAKAKLGTDVAPVTYGSGGNDAFDILSSDGKSIVVLAAYTTKRVEAGVQFEEYWRIIAFKSYDNIRVIRSFVGEDPNMSNSRATDVRVQTKNLANRKGVVHHILLVLDSAGAIETSTDVIQVLQGQEVKAAPVAKAIIDGFGTYIPKEIENLLIYGLITG
jgi:hypothetical protein